MGLPLEVEEELRRSPPQLSPELQAHIARRMKERELEGERDRQRAAEQAVWPALEAASEDRSRLPRIVKGLTLAFASWWDLQARLKSLAKGGKE